MELSHSVVRSRVEAYPDHQPLSTVEDEHIELLPETFADGDYGWRDAEWVVQWYGRRFLGEVPNADRRAIEDAYDDNDYETVHDAISTAVEAADAAAMLDSLTDLSGVDVQVASAFCQYINPSRFVVLDERQWSMLCAAGELTGAYPSQPTVADYERYLETYRGVASRLDCTLWDLYRTLWVLAVDS